MKNRILCMLLVWTMILGLFAACGSDPADQSSDSAGAPSTDTTQVTELPAEEDETPAPSEDSALESSAEEAESAVETAGPLGYQETPYELPLVDEPVTYSLFTSDSPQVGDNMPPLQENMVFEELEKRTGIHLEIETVSAMSYNDNFMLMIAGGDWTDLISNVRTTYSGGLAAAVAEEIIIDLSEYEEYMPNYSALIHSDENLYRDVTLGDGSMGAFYGVYSDMHELDAGLMVRGDWLDELGLEAPETIDEYYEVLTAFHNEYGAVMHLPTNGEMANQAFLSAYDVAGFYIDAGFFTSLQCYTVQDGQMICGFMEDGFKQYLQLMNKWYSENLISHDYMSSTSTSNYLGDNSDAVSDLLNDKIGIWGDSVNTIVNYDNTNSVDPDFRAQPTKLPTLEKGDTVKCGQYYSRLDEAYYSVTTACDDPEIIISWIDYAYTSEGYELYNWGLEDVTYTVNEDGSKQYTELILDNPDDYTVDQAKFIYLGVGSYVHDLDAYHQPHSDLQMECFEVWNSNFTGDYAVSTQLAMTVDEGTEFARLSSDIITYLSEAVAQFIVGEKNFEEDYDAFLADMESLGVDELTELEQNVYDRWVGTSE